MAEPAQAVEPQDREAWWVRHYTFTGTAVGLVFIWFSMTPSLLPRGPLFQGLVSGLAGAYRILAAALAAQQHGAARDRRAHRMGRDPEVTPAGPAFLTA